MLGGRQYKQQKTGLLLQYTKGPKLLYARWGHQCGIMNDETHYYLVVAGGKGKDGKTTSVEILDLTSLEWSLGMQNELSRGSRKDTSFDYIFEIFSKC